MRPLHILVALLVILSVSMVSSLTLKEIQEEQNTLAESYRAMETEANELQKRRIARSSNAIKKFIKFFDKILEETKPRFRKKLTHMKRKPIIIRKKHRKSLKSEPPIKTNGQYPPQSVPKTKSMHEPPIKTNGQYPPQSVPKTKSRHEPPIKTNGQYPPQTKSRHEPPIKTNGQYPPQSVPKTKSKSEPPIKTNGQYPPPKNKKS